MNSIKFLFLVFLGVVFGDGVLGHKSYEGYKVYSVMLDSSVDSKFLLKLAEEVRVTFLTLLARELLRLISS